MNLTLDHKPTCEEERQRLEASGVSVWDNASILKIKNNNFRFFL